MICVSDDIRPIIYVPYVYLVKVKVKVKVNVDLYSASS